jgi:hypothetical protein
MAQDQTDLTQLQTTVKQDDKLEVTMTNGDKVKGRMFEVTAERIVLKTNNGSRDIAASQITKVQRRKNGVLLGALIGAGAGVPFAIFVAEYSHNEGGSSAAAALPIVFGVGLGTGIDALLGSKKTLYDRSSNRRITLAPVIDKHGVGARVAFKF